MGLRWHGDKVKKTIDKGMRKRLQTAALLWVRYVTQQLNRRLNRDGNSPSTPGGFPAMVSSHLRGRITWEEIQDGVKVGTNVIYGKFLELGTRKMRKRPWMTLANRALKSKIKRILSRPF